MQLKDMFNLKFYRILSHNQWMHHSYYYTWYPCHLDLITLDTHILGCYYY